MVNIENGNFNISRKKLQLYNRIKAGQLISHKKEIQMDNKNLTQIT